jgi:cell division protein FtsQ
LKKLKRPADRRRPEPQPEKRRKTARVLAAVLVLALVAVGLLAWLAFYTNVCAIERVRVTGNRNLTSEQVRQLSGVGAYKNLMTLPVGRLAANLERDPWIKSARVSRHLLHTVNIAIEERPPLAMLDYSGAGFLVDAAGIVIAPAAEDSYASLPRVYCAELAPPKPGDKIKDKAVMGSLEIMGSMPAGLKGSVVLANPFDGRGQVFASKDGFNIVYGDASDLAKKNEVLQAIVTDISNTGRKIAYVDVSVPDAPVIKPK